jgi:thiol-disulfide isomerase/thioredoxin
MPSSFHTPRKQPSSSSAPSPVVRRRAGAVPRAVSDVLRGSGRLLDADVRASMEPRLGRDFSHVRLHDDAAAAESTRLIGARAYSAGSSIVVDSSRYSPGSDDGRRVLAHELTHVAQHSTPTAGPTGALTLQEHPAREAEADNTADAVMRGRAHPPATHIVDANAVQRQTEGNAAGSPGGASAGAASGAATAAPCIEAVVGEDPKTLTEAGTVTIVEFGAEWCSPCKMLQASLEQMCQGFAVTPPKAPVRIFSIDVDAAGNEDIAARYAAGNVPHLYMYVGGAEKAHYASALQPDVLEALVAEYADEASQSGAWKGFKKGAFWGGLIGLGLGIGGAVGLTQTALEGNDLMGAMLGSVAGGALAGAAIGGGIGALAGKLGEEKKGSRRKKKKQPKRRAGTAYESDELEADAIAARALSGPRRNREASAGDAPAGPRGTPIHSSLRFDMESRFGRDFSRVRLHRDAEAHRVADSMQAYAVTEGADIYFARDGYAPETPAGRAILAHELAHVAQQDIAAPSAAVPSLESEAARAAAGVAQGARISIQHAAGDGTPPLPITRGKKTALGGLIGAGGGAAAGALIGLGVAALSSDVSAAAGAGIGALIGAGAGLIGGLLFGYLSRRTERVGAAEADALIRRRYGRFMLGGVPAPLRDALIRPVSSAELCERVRCRRPAADCDLVGWTDTGVPWRAAAPPTETITRPEDEPTCHGKQMEHATPQRPVIYFNRDTADAGILVHEGLHAISHPEFQRLHNVVNEGTTELYTRRLLGDVNIAPVTGTPYDTYLVQVEKLERLVGEEPLARAYFAGDVGGLDRAAAAIFGPCSLRKWAFALQANHGESQEADDVLAGRSVDYCAQGSERLGADAAAAPAPGGDGEGHHK